MRLWALIFLVSDYDVDSRNIIQFLFLYSKSRVRFASGFLCAFVLYSAQNNLLADHRLRRQGEIPAALSFCSIFMKSIDK